MVAPKSDLASVVVQDFLVAHERDRLDRFVRAVA